MGLNPISVSIENKIEALNASQIELEEKIVMPETLVVEKVQSEGLTTKDMVTLYFKDTPVLVSIAKCESTFKHLDKNGNVVRGKINKQDVGVMQINEKYHLKESEALGYDIYTLEGNMAYAKYLYEKKGSQPWVSSSACWKKLN